MIKKTTRGNDEYYEKWTPPQTAPSRRVIHNVWQIALIYEVYMYVFHVCMFICTYNREKKNTNTTRHDTEQQQWLKKVKRAWADVVIFLLPTIICFDGLCSQALTMCPTGGAGHSRPSPFPYCTKVKTMAIEEFGKKKKTKQQRHDWKEERERETQCMRVHICIALQHEKKERCGRRTEPIWRYTGICQNTL